MVSESVSRSGSGDPTAALSPMAILDILRYPDPRLHTVAKPVSVVDERIRQLVRDMA
jgi:hypothetical protein